jgi:hypothetical protein
MDFTKTELKKLIKDIFEEETEKREKELEKKLTEKEVRDVVKKMFVNYFKFLWDRRSFWTNNL